ncbi:conserved domain protein [Lachnospiraceae bacterium KM106-2]|nr:conserved domain protein [Lachnospiraceae bacterium KM106-2]
MVKKTYRRKKVTKKKDVTVYITNTGKKFHRGNCRYLRKSKISIKKSQAKKRGYTACKICRP